jgi:hypothetical protein
LDWRRGESLDYLREISVTSAAGSVWMGLFIHGLSSFPYSLGLSPRRLLAQFLSEQDGAAVPEG